MNREIKFRARWKDTGKVIPDFMEEYTIDALNDEKLFISQYTGLKDKNGKEIYEGDIVYLEICSKDDIACGFYGEHHVVIYCQGCFGWEEDGEFYSLSNIYSVTKVVGNIYENEELLK